MLGERWLLRSFVVGLLFVCCCFFGDRFGGISVDVIVCRASCNKAVCDGGTRSCMQGRLEPFGNLAAH